MIEPRELSLLKQEFGISDASVLIDIEFGVLFSEELSDRHGHLSQLGLISKTMSGELVAEAYSLRLRQVLMIYWHCHGFGVTLDPAF